ncbi:unnamed protein product [Ceratitis capitata]|uniref:(Mediterranean fruit fly) hypothetical protein n=1 Tax=Ceratitis capitata TaxID=7213 RepID=A0A811UI70_CERCA|nr:unnamed protein product [Ceratitis capitata]
MTTTLKYWLLQQQKQQHLKISIIVIRVVENWHHRLQGVTKLEEALRNSDILAQVQPCLDSLLRTLLSSERNPDVAEAKHSY